jgi:hypothetical protein
MLAFSDFVISEFRYAIEARKRREPHHWTTGKGLTTINPPARNM